MSRAGKIVRTLRRALFARRSPHAATVLIVGCQRSGTSMFLRIVERDWRAQVFGEKSVLFHDRVGDRRMIDQAAAVDRVSAARARLVAIKPLVESHRVPELIEAFPRTIAVWMFRDARSVALSNLAAFGRDNGKTDMAPILARDAHDWRSAGASPTTLDRAAALAAHVSEPVEWAALFWWVRNSIFFDQGYDTHPAIFTCAYDDVVGDPVAVMTGLYRAAGVAFPGEHVTSDVDARSVGRHRDLALHPEIGAACDEMFARLRSTDQRRSLTQASGPIQ